MSDLGTKLKALREAAGLSQRQLAERAGLHQTYVANVESGRQALPAERLAGLAVAIGVSDEDLDELFVLLAAWRGALERPPGLTDEAWLELCRRWVREARERAGGG